MPRRSLIHFLPSALSPCLCCSPSAQPDSTALMRFLSLLASPFPLPLPSLWTLHAPQSHALALLFTFPCRPLLYKSVPRFPSIMSLSPAIASLSLLSRLPSFLVVCDATRKAFFLFFFFFFFLFFFFFFFLPPLSHRFPSSNQTFAGQRTVAFLSFL
ncbi:hypothetical protein ACQY0O_005428 [Thecaphora frezii]